MCNALSIRFDTDTEVLMFDRAQSNARRSDANALLVKTCKFVMVAELLFGESKLGRFNHNEKAFSRNEAGIIKTQCHEMVDRHELRPGGSLFRTGQIYVELLQDVLTTSPATGVILFGIYFYFQSQSGA